MPDAHKNFAYSTVATSPSPDDSGTSLVVNAGDGALFPTPPFNATVWPASTQPLKPNAEIVRVTAIATDTFTITRAQESSTARHVAVGDQIAATITAKTLTDVELVNQLPLIPSGLYSLLSVANNATHTLTKDRECCIGFLLGAQTISEIAVNVRTAGDTGAVVRLGIRNDVAGLPSSVAAQGTIDATGTGWKSLVVNYSHPGGILWLTYTGQLWTSTAVVVDLAQNQTGGLPMISAAPRSTLDFGTGNMPTVGYQTGVSGSLGSTFTNANSTFLYPIVLAAKAA